jgi:hypothetical protein
MSQAFNAPGSARLDRWVDTIPLGFHRLASLTPITSVAPHRRTPNHKRIRLYATLHRWPMAHRLWRGDIAQRIDRIFSRACNVQQQEASHDADIFVEGIHAVDLLRTCDCPIAVPNKGSSQRV